MTQPLAGKSILITGGGSGIGRATAIVCVEQGARVVVTGRNPAALEETVAQVRARGGDALAVQGDVSDAAQVIRMVEAAVHAFGRLDCAFNNAGVGGPVGKRLAEIDEASWDSLMQVNLRGVWLCMKHEITQMLRQGEGGSIVNMASLTGLVGLRGLGAYGASKHGVVGLTRIAALDYAADGVRVNAICPGFVETPMLEKATADRPGAMDRLSAATPINRIARPEEIGAAVAWLLSDAASFVTGSPFPVDGGWTAQ